MKKFALIVSVTFAVFISLFVFTVQPVQAQTCSGSVTCEHNCGTIYTPLNCKTSCPPFQPSCTECTGFTTDCDETETACGFEHVGNSCAGDCTSVSGTFVSSNCSYQAAPTPRPAQTLFACNTNTGSCYESAWGSYTNSGTCDAACDPPPEDDPPPPPPPGTRYICNATSRQCNEISSDTAGFADWSNCMTACAPEPPVTPEPTPEPPTDPPPPGSCLDEHDCSVNINQFDCCAGTCVAEGSNCPPPECSNVDQFGATNVWLRVVSQDPTTGSTISWKGPQDTSPVVNTNWSVQGLTAEGNFQQYRGYENVDVKTFNTTKNKIDSQMRVDVGSSPNGTVTIISCESEVEQELPTTPAHGLAWSNHFCSGGWAWEPEASGRYPAKTKEAWDVDYYTRMNGAEESREPQHDPDGCYGLFLNGYYHEQIVKLLTFADANHWADLRYDEYWSLAYQAWDEYGKTRDIDTVITLTPPKNHYCFNAYWYKVNNDEIATTQSVGTTLNTDGSCLVRFNPGSRGNLLVMEVKKVATIESCTIILEDPYTAPNVLTSNLTIDNYSAFNAHVTGESSEPVPPAVEQTKLWFAKEDFTALDPADIPEGFIADENNTPTRSFYYYENNTGLNQQCYANSEQACSMSVNVTKNVGILPLPIFPVGKYKVFCDSAGGASSCSGNPQCVENGGTVDCAAVGYKDCVPDTETPHDNATLTVACKPICSVTCSDVPYADGCGGMCPVGEDYGVPATPNVIEPSMNAQFSPTSASPHSYDIQWTVSDISKIGRFELVVYRKSTEFANNATAAHQAYMDGRTDEVVSRQIASDGSTFYEYEVDLLPLLTGQDWDMQLAIRSINTSCSNEGPWQYVDFKLVGSISGAIYLDPNNNCSSSTPISTYLTSASSVVATPIGGMPNFSFGSTNSFVGANYSINFLPYSPTFWNESWNYRRWQAQLNIQNPNLEEAYVCSSCNRLNPTSIFTCNATDKTVPSTANYFVRLMNLANDAWWQTWGGNVYGQSTVYSDVPPSCTGPNCKRTMIANINTAGTDNSAGVPISQGTVNAGDGNFFSQNNISAGGNPRANSISSAFSPTLENFTYFLTNINIPIPTSVTDAGDVMQVNRTVNSVTELIEAFRRSGSDLNYYDTQVDSTKIVWADNHLTVNLGTANDGWAVPAGQKWIVFAPGNITFTGPTTDHSQSAQEYLIQVPSGGFLAFIAGGNITFNADLGYGFDGDIPLDTYNTPVVEGVYIASNTLTVQSRSATNPNDFKFVGAGTFVGWGGVVLERDFDDGQTRKSLHNNSPTELFIYRPDLIINTPEFMRKPTIDWKEVN